MAFNEYMHERNIYRKQPDFSQIILDFPEFRKYVLPIAKGQKFRVDFTNTSALRMLTKILLKKDFDLDVDIPEGFLIPTVPMRLNYILWLEDLLCNVSEKKDNIKGIDIGTGPCAIFSLLGAKKNGWKFVATESSNEAIQWAVKNISKNNLEENITVLKVSEGSTLNEVLSSNNENYDFCLCNPPFFENIEEIRNKHRKSKETIADQAQKEEIFVKGGELDFVKNILKDSLVYKNRVVLFTSMFGKKKSLLEIIKEIQEVEGVKFTKTEFCQGNTVRWGIAWTFKESIHFEEQVKRKKKQKAKKAKPPLEYPICLPKSEDISLESVVKQTQDFLKTLQIPNTVTKKSQNFTELLLKSDTNTWTHQRRKRRELERQKKMTDNVKKKYCSSSPNKSCDFEENTDTGVKKELCHNCNAANSVNADMVQNSKRKLDTVSDDSQVNKKIKLESESSNDLNIKDDEINISNEMNMTEDPSFKNLDTSPKNFNAKEKYCSSSPNKSCNFEENTDTGVKKELCHNCNAANSVNADMVQNSKRKLDTVSEDSQVNKKIKLESESSNDLNMKDDEINISNEMNMIEDPSFKNLDASLKNFEAIILPGKSSETSTVGVECQKVLNSVFKDNVDTLSSSFSQSKEKVTESPTFKNPEDSPDVLKNEQSCSEQGLVLHCFLQFIKGKTKIYVKMNCPDTADRNTMYQVFQLIKNKIN